MTIITIYKACDGEEFETEEECLEYEESYISKLNEISRCWRMYDKTENLISIAGIEDIEEALSAFEDVFNETEHLCVDLPLSEETILFLKDYYGFTDIPNKIGEYKYNYDIDEWVKI